MREKILVGCLVTHEPDGLKGVVMRIEGDYACVCLDDGRPMMFYVSDLRWTKQNEIKPSNPKDIVGIRKAPMSTVSAAVMAEIGVAMLEGAAKYGRYNYRAVGVRASIYYDATLRHLFSWWEGEDLDPDSGMSHITKAITSLVVLRDAMIQNKVTDDRAPSSVPFYPALNSASAEILDRHAGKNPYHYTIADGQGMTEHAAREEDARLIEKSNAEAA